MAEILSNIQVSHDVFRMKVAGEYEGKPGQFFMVRKDRGLPLLPRPLSIFDLQKQKHYIEFLYQVVGEGTRQFAHLRRGDEIELTGPLGNGFPIHEGRSALVGGGIGIAPLYYTASHLLRPDLYLGFREEPYVIQAFKSLGLSMQVTVGGSILDQLSMNSYDHIYMCGPEGMLRAAQRMQTEQGYKGNLYLSLEKRMACGIGACLVCSVKTKSGNRRTCVEGPVFTAQEVEIDA
ncbi:dihydroorotate dehydrogenase electron transfer subunit [Paenibacillus tuaregi]|uniref:dihydroorotate dehydrogenase electron transfer subunit n=1 Tax=Paenibacillus tuaregi TaxID=1816681 RepID=UPI0008381A7D|nr:dihydroorotate dehydrogenase electron transfer subunit [Paenibacillus tuaregi]